MARIKITAGNVVMEAELNDSPTAAKLLGALPISASGSRWGDEIYFCIPVSDSEAPDARQEVEVGSIAYWPPGSAFCIFWGRTPASTGDAPMAASPVNVLGKVVGDATQFGAVRSGAAVKIEKA